MTGPGRTLAVVGLVGALAGFGSGTASMRRASAHDRRASLILRMDERCTRLDGSLDSLAASGMAAWDSTYYKISEERAALSRLRGDLAADADAEMARAIAAEAKYERHARFGFGAGLAFLVLFSYAMGRQGAAPKRRASAPPYAGY